MMGRIKLGELLVRAGVLDEYKLNVALSEQRRWGGRIGKILVDMNFVSEDVLVRALSKQLGVPLAQLDKLSVPPELTRKIDEGFARQHHLVPERFLPERRTLVVAMADPIDVKSIDEIAYRTGLRIEPTLAGERAIAQAANRVYGADAMSLDAPSEAIFLSNQGQVIERSRPPEPRADSFEMLPLAAPLDGRGSRPPTRAPAPPPPAPAVAAGQLAPMIDTLEGAQRKQRRAIRAMVDLLVDKGVFSREEYLARLNRR
jgi:hypothetical protein